MERTNSVGRFSFGGKMLNPNTRDGEFTLVAYIASGALHGPTQQPRVIKLVEALDLSSPHGAHIANALYARGLLRDNPEAMRAYVEKIDPNTRDGYQRIRTLEKDHHLRSHPEYIDTIRTKINPETKAGIAVTSMFDRIPQRTAQAL